MFIVSRVSGSKLQRSGMLKTLFEPHTVSARFMSLLTELWIIEVAITINMSLPTELGRPPEFRRELRETKKRRVKSLKSA